MCTGLMSVKELWKTLEAEVVGKRSHMFGSRETQEGETYWASADVGLKMRRVDQSSRKGGGVSAFRSDKDRARASGPRRSKETCAPRERRAREKGRMARRRGKSA